MKNAEERVVLESKQEEKQYTKEEVKEIVQKQFKEEHKQPEMPISDEEKQLCDDLLWYRTEDGNDPVANFAAYFRDKKVDEKKVDKSTLTVEKRLELNIVEGTKENLIEQYPFPLLHEDLSLIF